MSVRRAVAYVAFPVLLCASCSGSGPYSLGDDRLGEGARDAGGADATTAVPDGAIGDAAISDGAPDASSPSPASILCGPDAKPCAADEFCDFADTACGTTAVVGRCLPRPASSDCPVDCNPVCGCDGLSYCNECFAHVAGFDRRLPCP